MAEVSEKDLFQRIDLRPRKNRFSVFKLFTRLLETINEK